MIRKCFGSLWWGTLAAVFFLGKPSPGVAETTSPQQKVAVVATILPLADWLRQVGGENVDVTVLVPPGRSPHTFEPTPSDLRRIARCRLFVSVGLGLDDWANRLGETASGATRLALGERLKERGLLPTELLGDHPTTAAVKPTASEPLHKHHDHDHCDHGHGPDPHFWLDPLLAREAVSEIAQALTKVAPGRTPEWNSRAEAYRQQLLKLHEEIATQLEPCRGKAW